MSRQRRSVLDAVAEAVPVVGGDAAMRVAVDGVDGAGKTVFADQLGDVLTAAGRPVIRASVDNFHRPRTERYRRGRDSPSGSGWTPTTTTGSAATCSTRWQWAATVSTARRFTT